MQRLAPLTLSPLKTPIWARSGHAQTLAGYLLPSARISEYGEEHEITLDDGDKLLIFITRGRLPVVVTQFHGLTGDMTANYMQRGALLAREMGFSHVFVNHRGAGPRPHLARAPYHSGRQEDAAAVIRYLRKLFPDQKHIAVGYSMSANILLLLLGMGDPQAFPDAAVTINAPIDLRSSSDLLRKGFNRLYDQNFIISFRQMLKTKAAHGILDHPVELPWNSSIWDFDELYTAPAAGFKSREHYYQECSSVNHVSKINIPTYVLTAANDPFVDVETYKNAKWSKAVQLTISSNGGHLGYYDRRRLAVGGHRWMDYYLAQALQALTSNESLKFPSSSHHGQEL